MLDFWYTSVNSGVETARSRQVVETQKTERALGGRGVEIENLGVGV